MLWLLLWEHSPGGADYILFAIIVTVPHYAETRKFRKSSLFLSGILKIQ